MGKVQTRTASFSEPITEGNLAGVLIASPDEACEVESVTDTSGNTYRLHTSLRGPTAAGLWASFAAPPSSPWSEFSADILDCQTPAFCAVYVSHPTAASPPGNTVSVSCETTHPFRFWIAEGASPGLLRENEAVTVQVAT